MTTQEECLGAQRALLHAYNRLNDIPHDYARTDFKGIELALIDLGVKFGSLGYPPHLQARIDEIKVYPEAEDNKDRKCKICGKGPLRSGFCIGGGDAYYCSEDCLHHDYTEEEWAELYDDDGDNYWTKWED